MEYFHLNLNIFLATLLNLQKDANLELAKNHQNNIENFQFFDKAFPDHHSAQNNKMHKGIPSGVLFGCALI